ncbi:MAG: hypothetical protein P8Y47_04860 [Alphaproteobacteria bacterium]
MQITDSDIVKAVAEMRDSRVNMIVAGVDDYPYHRGYVKALDDVVRTIQELKKQKEADES